MKKEFWEVVGEMEVKLGLVVKGVLFDRFSVVYAYQMAWFKHRY